MKHHLNHITAALAGMILSMLSPNLAQAYSFGQKEVDQSKFIAIAVPFSEGKQYNLIILEQISATQTCWREKTHQPGVIDPLLLKFDFTGLCGRNTDSNGYSIRQAGLDLALDYRLSIVKRGGQLILMGYPVKNPTAPKLTIGRTQSVMPGFLKIDLAPGWRFSKRTYNSKTLGHIYFTHDHKTDTIASPPSAAKLKRPPKSVSPFNPPTQQAIALRRKSLAQQPASRRRQRPLLPPDSLQPKTSTPVSTESSSTKAKQNRDALTKLITSPIDIPVPDPNEQSSWPTPSSEQPSSGAGTQPTPDNDSELPVLSGEEEGSSITAPDSTQSPSSPSKGRNYRSSDQPSLRKQKSVTIAASPPLSPGSFSKPISIPVPSPALSTPNRSSTPEAPIRETENVQAAPSPRVEGMLLVPEGDVPLGSFDPDPDIYVASQDSGRSEALAALGAGDPPPPPLDDRSRLRYRVIIKTTDANQQTKVKSLIPDAFRSSYQGKPALQVGAYESQEEANERLEILNQAGLIGVIETR